MLQPGYGYVWVTQFRENTYDDLVAALERLEAQDPPLKGLVLDLRDNPGGVLDQAISISDLFLEEGVIMTSKGRLERHTRVYSASRDDAKPRRYPMVVLINGGSASASEIVAGALQDQKRALILGTTSFGKGSVQSIENLRDGYALKLTIARYYTPSGRSIQAKGVAPDIVVPHEILADVAADQQRRLKEKDLANHLDAGVSKPSADDTADESEENPEGSAPEMLVPGDIAYQPAGCRPACQRQPGTTRFGYSDQFRYFPQDEQWLKSAPKNLDAQKNDLPNDPAWRWRSPRSSPGWGC